MTSVPDQISIEVQFRPSVISQTVSGQMGMNQKSKMFLGPNFPILSLLPLPIAFRVIISNFFTYSEFSDCTFYFHYHFWICPKSSTLQYSTQEVSSVYISNKSEICYFTKRIACIYSIDVDIDELKTTAWRSSTFTVQNHHGTIQIRILRTFG